MATVEPPRREPAGAKEEYASLRNEQLYRVQSIHRVIGLIITGFFASAIVMLWGRGMSEEIDPEKLFWTSPLLLGMVAIAVFVLIRWHRLFYRAGSYLVVFHERPGPDDIPENTRLGWLTSIRRPDAPKSIIKPRLWGQA